MSNSPAYQRFLSSMTIDHEKWRDGIGYDLAALRELSAGELSAAVNLMRACDDWRDVEALAEIATLQSISADAATAAKEALRERAKAKTQTGLRAAEALQELGESAGLEEKVVATLLRMRNDDSFTQALEMCQDMRSQPLTLALLKCARDHPSQGVTCAAMVYYHTGLASEVFDWSQRPFFLRFNPHDPADRAKAFVELCAKVGVDPIDLK